MAEKDNKSKSTPASKNTTAKSNAKLSAKAKSATEKPKANASTKPAPKQTADKPKASPTSKKPVANSVKSEKESPKKEKPAAKDTKATTTPSKAKNEQVKVENKDVKPAAKTEPKKIEEKPKAKTEKKEVEEQSKNKEKSEPKKQSDNREKSSDKKEKPSNSKGKKPKEGKKASSKNSLDTQKKKSVIIGVVCGVLILALIIGIICGVKSCQNGAADSYRCSYQNTTKVGYYGKEIGTVKRVKPVSEIKNEGLPAYPVYGKSLKSVLGEGNESARNDLIAEANKLAATGTKNAGGGGGYSWMDENGYLYGGTRENPVSTGRQLYQHTSSVGMYGGNVDDSEPRVIKEMTFRPRSYLNGYSVTGLYAPAGEVIKIQISEKDMEATGGITIHIGQALYNGKANNIWTAKNQMNRFPVILNTMSVTKNTAKLEDGVYTAYVGSFLGGPIYIRNRSVTFKTTISGGVNYSHFILGYTTPEEFERNAKSSAPYFDMEVWDYGMLHSGPKSYSNSFTYEDIYKAAVLWEKVSLVTTYSRAQGIVFLYDPFVAAGAAVAFPGQGSVNCPTGWMKDSLNYKKLTTSGSWGNFHEYHHNFQGYGVGNGGEVTNNGLTLVSYALFTKISSARGIGNYGSAGMSGWNRYTSATWSLEEVLKIRREDQNPGNGKQGLALYANLLHNFGADNFIKARAKQSGGQGYVQYLKAWQEVTHNDLTYYFKDILQGIDEEQAAELSNPEYSKFVPVSSVYQTGRSYMYDGEKKYFQTMQPFVITYGEDFNIDLNRYTYEDGAYKEGSINLPEGFSYKIKNVSDPEYGKIVPQGNGIYTFKPDKKHLQSGKILVTLQITKDDDPSFRVDDVDLVLEFEQTHEKNKYVLERTTYSYDESKMYTDAVEAYNKNYANYSEKVEGDSKNPTQNSNTDIWYYPDNDKYKDSPYVVKNNSVAEVRGKLYFKDKGTYRLYLRGRTNCAMYYSIGDDQNYQLGAKINDKLTTANFRTNDPNTYVDIVLDKEETWVYFKTVLIVQSTPAVSFVGLGFAQWTEPTFTIREETDNNGNVVEKYYDANGKEVTQEEANNVELIEPKSATYATAYRSSYEFPQSEFQTEYFYTRKYKYDYNDKAIVSEGKTQTPTADCNYVAWTGQEEELAIENLFDGKNDTGIHFSEKWGVSEANPAILAFDLGESITANCMTLYSYQGKGFPKNFVLQGSVDGVEYEYMGQWTNIGAPKTSVDLQFIDGKEFTFRYYKLKITATSNGRCALSGLTFSHEIKFTGNGDDHFSPDNAMFTFSKKWKSAQVYSTFGHVYVGKKGDKMKFEFEGTNFLILSSIAYANEFQVKIDGKVVPSQRLKAEKDEIYASYISSTLSSGRHTVEIKCLGKASIDSIVIYNKV